jgi:hypothetical protein
MHRLNELVEKLTPSQVKEVEDFAEFLLARKSQSKRKDREEYLDVSKVAGMLANLAPEKTAVELAHEATDALTEKYLR